MNHRIELTQALDAARTLAVESDGVLALSPIDMGGSSGIVEGSDDRFHLFDGRFGLVR